MTELEQYRDFLRRKVSPKQSSGIEVSEVRPGLMDFQASATKWALRNARAALWLSTGPGKTYCELAFGYHAGGMVANSLPFLLR